MDACSFSQSIVGYSGSSLSAESLIHNKLRTCLKPQSLEFKYPVSKIAGHVSVQTRPSCQKQRTVKIACSQKLEVPVLQARTIDEIYDNLAERLVPKAAAAAAANPYQKYIVGLAAPPGAGKSTLAREVVQRVNKLWQQKDHAFDEQIPPEVAVVLPMDGFHLYRRQLDAMENPEEAHARRGAPWTFDPARLVKSLKNLRDHGSVCVPSFDHGVGDPVEDDVFISLNHKVVIVEGNYLLLGEGTWKELPSMFDETWFIDIEIDKSMQRVLKRHISTGKPPEIAKWRVDYNDRPNAELILKSKSNADLIIKSVDFTS